MWGGQPLDPTNLICKASHCLWLSPTYHTQNLGLEFTLNDFCCCCWKPDVLFSELGIDLIGLLVRFSVKPARSWAAFTECSGDGYQLFKFRCSCFCLPSFFGLPYVVLLRKTLFLHLSPLPSTLTLVFSPCDAQCFGVMTSELSNISLLTLLLLCWCQFTPKVKNKAEVIFWNWQHTAGHSYHRGMAMCGRHPNPDYLGKCVGLFGEYDKGPPYCSLEGLYSTISCGLGILSQWIFLLGGNLGRQSPAIFNGIWLGKTPHVSKFK